MEQQRRTGRTTKLIAKAIVELLENGDVHFIDHPKGNGVYHDGYYRHLRDKIVWLVSVLLDNINPLDVFEFKVLPKDGGIKITTKTK